jgi:hypothetical protein
VHTVRCLAVPVNLEHISKFTSFTKRERKAKNTNLLVVYSVVEFGLFAAVAISRCHIPSLADPTVNQSTPQPLPSLHTSAEIKGGIA